MNSAEAMIDAALDAFYGAHLRQPNGEWHADDRVRMSTALVAALFKSGYENALSSFPLPSHNVTGTENYERILSWLYAGIPNPAGIIINCQMRTL